MNVLAAPPASYAGIITAVSSVILALGTLITALAVFLPILRTAKRTEAAVAESQTATSAQLRVIHTLVNSTLTAAMQSELDATRREAMLLRELMTMRSDAGSAVSDDQRAVLGAAQRRIQELQLAMDDRLKQTRSANIQVEKERERQQVPPT